MPPRTRRRKVSLTLRTDPDGYARGGGRSVGRLVWSRLGSLGSPGWDVHPVARMGSRYSIGKEGQQEDEDILERGTVDMMHVIRVTTCSKLRKISWR